MDNLNVGRPPKTLDDLPKDWQNIIFELAEAGKSEVRMRVDLSVGRTAWYSLKENNELFRETICRAKDLCQSHWEDLGQDNLKSRYFNGRVWNINMQNRFDYSSKKETDLKIPKIQLIEEDASIEEDEAID